MKDLVVWYEEEMTPQWFTDVLRHAGALGENSVVSASVSKFGGGVLTNMVRAELEYSSEGKFPESVLVKFPSHDPGNRNIAKVMGLYDLEVGFYRDVAQTLPDLNMPSSYLAEFAEAEGGFTLVLEDCSATTVPGSSKAHLSEDECALSLIALAKMQAPHWGGQSLSDIGWLNNSERTVAMFDGIAAALEQFLQRFGSQLEDRYVDFFKIVLPKAGQWVREWAEPKVLQHGEFRGGNVLLPKDSDSTDVTIIDFQTIRIGPPGVDPAYFMGGSIAPEDRRRIERDVVRRYHEELIRLGVKNYSWDDCWHAYRAGAMYGVYLLVGMAGQVEPSERNDNIILTLTRQYAEMAIDLNAAEAAGLM